MEDIPKKVLSLVTDIGHYMVNEVMSCQDINSFYPSYIWWGFKAWDLVSPRRFTGVKHNIAHLAERDHSICPFKDQWEGGWVKKVEGLRTTN